MSQTDFAKEFELPGSSTNQVVVSSCTYLNQPNFPLVWWIDQSHYNLWRDMPNMNHLAIIKRISRMAEWQHRVPKDHDSKSIRLQKQLKIRPMFAWPKSPGYKIQVNRMQKGSVKEYDHCVAHHQQNYVQYLSKDILKLRLLVSVSHYRMALEIHHLQSFSFLKNGDTTDFG